MDYRRLGRSGLKVSEICLGTMTFGNGADQDEASRMVGTALDAGVNFFDTANSYVGGVSETMLGEALKGRRQDAVVASKVFNPMGGRPNDSGMSRLHIKQQVEDSLRRLQTDYIDVYYIHHVDVQTPLEEMLRAFDDLVRQGKIRYAALSTYPAWQMTEALWTAERRGFAPPACNQIAYSLANRAAEQEMLPACRQFGVGVAVFSPLAGGLLAGPAVRQRPVAGGLRWGASGFSGQQVALAERLEALAGESGQPPAVLALGWLVSRPGVSAALIGPETIAELEANAAAGAIELEPELLERVDALGRE